MNNETCIFQGATQVYLDGRRVLAPVDWMSANKVNYFLGTEESNVEIQDRRSSVNTMLLHAMENGGKGWSPDLFSTQAYTTVFQDGKHISVSLDDYEGSAQDKPILWMGVIEGDELPANPLSWLWLADSGDERTAFVGLVEP